MTISIIIPTLNENRYLADTLRNVRGQHPHEIIVVDGGSHDDTLKAARAADAVLTTPRGRAQQMNAGAAQATGDTLLFLHADCTLEAGALTVAEQTLQDCHIAAGCFQMRVHGEHWLYRSIDRIASMRVRLTGIVYGDQGFFLRRDHFEQLGGFPQLRLMEDVFLSKRMRRLGKIVVVPKQIHVSPRRWEQAGVVRQTLRNWTLVALAGAGVPPDRLARYYPVLR